MQQKIEELEAEIRRLNLVVKELAAALKVLADKEERAAEFVARVESLLGDSTHSD